MSTQYFSLQLKMLVLTLEHIIINNTTLRMGGIAFFTAFGSAFDP